VVDDGWGVALGGGAGDAEGLGEFVPGSVVPCGCGCAWPGPQAVSSSAAAAAAIVITKPCEMR
jgi:hypothetical protein